jgi:GT2 family glycosyltransferase
MSDWIVDDVRISVVTPSYNQGQFLEETIRSVFEQSYSNLEYSVLDAGSTDGTIEILHKYDSKLSFWRSEADEGQAAAINEGFRRASGDILCWLNSDDLHGATTLKTVAQLMGSRLDQPVVLYGGCEMFDDRTRWREVRSAISFSRELLETVDFLDQPSVFWTRRAWEMVGPLDETLHYGFDWNGSSGRAKSAALLRLTACCHVIGFIGLTKAGPAAKSDGSNCWRSCAAILHRPSSAITSS